MSSLVGFEPQHAIAPVVGAAVRYERGLIPDHIHTDWCQLVYAVKGMMSVVTPMGRWVLPVGRALWIYAGVAHKASVQHTADVQLVFVRPGTKSMPKWQGCNVVNISPLVRELIAHCVRMPWDYAPESAHAHISTVLLEQMSIMQQAPVHLAEPKDKRASRLADMVRCDVTDRRPLNLLAPLVGASPRTLERLFVSETGGSFGAWRHRHRMIVALEHLASGEAVANVAQKIGYANSSSFVAAFHATFGETPARYFGEIRA